MPLNSPEVCRTSKLRALVPLISPQSVLTHQMRSINAPDYRGAAEIRGSP